MPSRSAAIRQILKSGFRLQVYLFYFLNHFKKPQAFRNPHIFRDGEAMSRWFLFRAAFIYHHRIGRWQIQVRTPHTFYGCAKMISDQLRYILRRRFPLPNGRWHVYVISKSIRLQRYAHISILKRFTFSRQHFQHLFVLFIKSTLHFLPELWWPVSVLLFP